MLIVSLFCAWPGGHRIDAVSSVLWSVGEQLSKSESGLFLAVSPAPRTALSTSDWINVGFPGGSAGEESACNAEDPTLISGSGVPLEKG